MTKSTEKQVRVVRYTNLFVAALLVMALILAFTQGGISSLFAAFIATICGWAFAMTGLLENVLTGKMTVKKDDEDRKS